jgi:hypothetical protein
MRRILFLTLLFLWGFTAFAQLDERAPADWKVIGRLKFGGITKAKLQYTNTGQDTLYMLFIKDVREQPKDNYFSITFRNTDDTYARLYSILKSFFLNENKKSGYSRTFKLGDTGVNVQHHLLVTGRGIMLTTKDGYTYWSEKDIDKLFGLR